jgi:TonB family protein
MKRFQDRLHMDTPQSDTRGLLKTGGVSLLFHLAMIILLVCYLKADGSNGGGGSSVYRVTIQMLSDQNNSTPLSLRRPSPTQAVSTKTQIQKEENKSREKQKLPDPASRASTPELSPRDEAGTEVEDSTVDVSLGGLETGQGVGSGGRGEGSGTGWKIPGLRGFGQDVSPPRYLENPKPDYPLKARQKEYEGKVLLKVEVLPNGRVRGVEVEKSSGYEELDQSALATVKKWRFIPAKKGMVAILRWVNIPIIFQLRDGGF